MLQAYALQQVILSMGYDCEIINFRSPAQKRQYKPIFVVGSFYGRCVRFIIQAAYVWGILKKQRLFEQFLNSELKLSYNEYGTLEDLEMQDSIMTITYQEAIKSGMYIAMTSTMLTSCLL